MSQSRSSTTSRQQVTEDQMKIIRWFARLDLKDEQRAAKPLSKFLKGFQRVKIKAGPMVCRISPCQKHQYARGVCAKHYQQLKALSDVVGWASLAALGLCKISGLKDLVVKGSKK